MTSFADVDVRCGACGHTSTQHQLMSTSSFGWPTLEGRSSGPASYAVRLQRCPRCPLAAPDLAAVTPAQAAAARARKAPTTISEAFESWAEVLLAASAPQPLRGAAGGWLSRLLRRDVAPDDDHSADAGFFLRHAAWAAEDDEEADRARALRSRAADLLLPAWAAAPTAERHGFGVQVADLLRRCGRFDDARAVKDTLAAAPRGEHVFSVVLGDVEVSTHRVAAESAAHSLWFASDGRTRADENDAVVRIDIAADTVTVNDLRADEVRRGDDASPLHSVMRSLQPDREWPLPPRSQVLRGREDVGRLRIVRGEMPRSADDDAILAFIDARCRAADDASYTAADALRPALDVVVEEDGHVVAVVPAGDRVFFGLRPDCDVRLAALPFLLGSLDLRAGGRLEFMLLNDTEVDVGGTVLRGNHASAFLAEGNVARTCGLTISLARTGTRVVERAPDADAVTAALERLLPRLIVKRGDAVVLEAPLVRAVEHLFVGAVVAVDEHIEVRASKYGITVRRAGNTDDDDERHEIERGEALRLGDLEITWTGSLEMLAL